MSGLAVSEKRDSIDASGVTNDAERQPSPDGLGTGRTDGFSAVHCYQRRKRSRPSRASVGRRPYARRSRISALRVPASVTFDVPGIPVGRLPIRVWASECEAGELEPSSDPLMGPGGGGAQPPRMPCPPPTVGAPPSAGCVAALEQARAARTAVLAACSARDHAQLQ